MADDSPLKIKIVSPDGESPIDIPDLAILYDTNGDVIPLSNSTFHDETGNRLVSTFYTNSTGKPMNVSISITGDISLHGDQFRADLTITPPVGPSITICSIALTNTDPSVDVGLESVNTLTGVIPDGWTYIISTNNSGSGDFSIDQWLEYY